MKQKPDLENYTTMDKEALQATNVLLQVGLDGRAIGYGSLLCFSFRATNIAELKNAIFGF